MHDEYKAYNVPKSRWKIQINRERAGHVFVLIVVPFLTECISIVRSFVRRRRNPALLGSAFWWYSEYIEGLVDVVSRLPKVIRSRVYHAHETSGTPSEWLVAMHLAA